MRNDGEALMGRGDVDKGFLIDLIDRHEQWE